jgi:hypothetical protein
MHTMKRGRRQPRLRLFVDVDVLFREKNEVLLFWGGKQEAQFVGHYLVVVDVRAIVVL